MLNLKSKNDGKLLGDLKNLVEEERKLLTQILHHLREVEDRKLYLERGYSGLYEFAMQELGYSDGAAYRRIQAMRLMKSVPEVEGKIESGEITLSVAAQTQSFFRQKEKNQNLSVDTKREVIEAVTGKSSRQCERVLAELSPEISTPTEKTKALPNQKTLIQFVAGPELMEKLEQLKGLLAHQNFEGRYDALIDKLADIALKKLDPTLQTPTPRATNSQPRRRTRHIPRAVAREVWKRDGGKCTYQNRDTGKVCASRHAVQFDHFITPFCQGGEHTIENLTLRCGAHNRYVAEKMGLNHEAE